MTTKNNTTGYFAAVLFSTFSAVRLDLQKIWRCSMMKCFADVVLRAPSR
jgi:hypothetical protein